MKERTGQELTIPGDAALNTEKEFTGMVIPPTTSEMVTMMLRDAGTLEITTEQREILYAPVDPESVEIRPDGLIYLPAMEYRAILCKAFGAGWALLPENPNPQIENNLILWGHYLFIQGQPVAFVFGEQEYRPNNSMMSYGDAIEGAASNALMRACKRLNISGELWRPRFIREWKEKYAEAYTVKEGRNRGKTQWRRKEVIETEVEAEVEAETEQPSNDETTPDTDQSKPESGVEFDSSDTSFWRRKAMQHATDLGMPEDEVTKLCQEHFYQHIATDDGSSGNYLKDQNGERVHVTEKKQLHWTQWKKLAQHLYQTWDAAGKPKAEKKSEATEAEGDQEDTPEPSGPKPETAEATFHLEAAKRFTTWKALDEWIHKVPYKKIPIKEWETEHFQKALPVLMEVPLLEHQKENEEEPVTKDDKPVEDAVEEAAREGTLEVAKSHFLDMLLERYPNIEDRMKWIAENISAPINEMDNWEHRHFEQGIELLSEMSSPTKEPAQVPDNDKGDFGLLITQETKSLIDGALLEFPDKKYQTIRSMAFRQMAYKAIGHEYTLYNKILNSDGRLILAALIKEKSEILLADLGDSEPVVTGEVVGEIVDDDPLGVDPTEAQDAFVKEQMEKAKEMGVPESVTDIIEGNQDEESRGDLLESYLEKAGERFADKVARKTWERDQELPFDLSIAKWPESEIKQGYAMLEGVTKLTGVPSGEPLMNDGQLGEMQGKIGDMHERFHDSLGSQPFLDLVFKVTKPERKKLKDLTEAEAGEVIMEMTDAVGTEKARKATAAKAAKAAE